MVTQHYRWDFIGLSTDEKPTPDTSDRVVDGSTFYCSDTSKLYVYCKDNWYERKPLGGGGGSSTDAVESFDFTSIFVKGQDALDTAGTTEATFSLTESEYTTAMTALTAGKTARVFREQEGGKDLFIATGGGTVTGESWLVTITLEVSQYMFEATESEETYSCTITEADFSGGGGGGDTVYSTVTTSSSSAGGAVYIGNLNSSQEEQPDPTATDNHYKYFWALPFGSNTIVPSNSSINILGGSAKSSSIVIGAEADNSIGTSAVTIGDGAMVKSNRGVSIGNSAFINNNVTDAVALGSRSNPTRSGEVNVGNTIGNGFNYTNYRVIGGVHDGQDAHDAMTVGQANALIDAINTALSTNIPHIGV